MSFSFFEGRFSEERYSEADKSVPQYRMHNAKLISLSKSEMNDLSNYYLAYILRVLYVRQRAATHYRWISEPATKSKALASRCNSYRDSARKKAYLAAYKMGISAGMLTEIIVDREDMPGPKGIRVQMSGRGHAWFKEYCNWYRSAYDNKRFWYEPTIEQFVDENGLDKDESTPKFPVRALKRIS